MLSAVRTALLSVILLGSGHGLEQGDCAKWHSQCNEGTCIRNWRLCDNKFDCPDGSDENAAFCFGFQCPNKKVKCADGLQCIKEEQQCNDRVDCNDSSDESAATCGPRDCEAGQYLDAFNFCQKCPKDTWSGPLNRAATCTPCPDNKGVDEGLGTQESDCEWKPCRPAHYLDPETGCQKCPLDTYAKWGNTQPTCTPCPNGMMVGIGQGKKESDCQESYSCPEGQLLCDRSKCIPQWKICNGVKDCLDGADEAVSKCQGYECMEGWLKCADGLQCIRERMMCNTNGKVHCNDGSDEDAVTCGREDQCPPNYVPCDESKCIKQWRLCDGRADCEDGSDEAADFCAEHECLEDKIKCANGLQCYKQSMDCNHKLNCADGSDESVEKCGVRTCPDDQILTKFNICEDEPEIDLDYPCLNELVAWKHCNGNADCDTGVDESEEYCTDYVCPADREKCADGLQCVRSDLTCNGIPNCIDGSDESMEKCGVLCQGGQYRDEATNTCQMCPENTWNSPGNGATSCTACPDGYRVDSGKGWREESCKWVDECLGDLPTFKLCNGKPDCDDGMDELPQFCIGYVCEADKMKCDDGLQCIKISRKCDGVVDCNDKSDEDPIECEGTCPRFETMCDDESKCIENWRLCDGRSDCGDASDEKPAVCRDYTCPEGKEKCDDGVQCIKSSQRCDGKKHCNDGSDERESLCGDDSSDETGIGGNTGTDTSGDGDGDGGDGDDDDDKEEPTEPIGEWSDFGDWSDCSTVCGDGIQTRFRTCPDGYRCVGGSDSETQPCNLKPCPVHGGWGPWTSWSECPVTCGGGVQTRSRRCDSPPPAYSGVPCTGAKTESRECNITPCPEADYDIYTGDGPNNVIKYSVFDRPDSFNGEISFMAGGEPLFQIGLHPETGTVAVTNEVYGGGVPQDGTNWVPAPFPEPQDGDRVYSMQFTSEGFVLKCFNEVLLIIPLNELTNNTAQFLSLVDNIHFDLTSDEGIIPAEFELTTQIDTTGMETTQSDEYLGAQPELAVDGSNSTCAGSGSTENNWWSIDLEDNFDIHEVVISGPVEIDGATVVALDGDTVVQTCGRVNYEDGEDTYKIKCGGHTSANKIRIDQPYNNLALCEVQLFGEPERACPAGQSQCSDGVTCIKASSVCDGVTDCPGDSDETDCRENMCEPGFQQCSDGDTCVEDENVCDGTNNCPDGDDELDCESPINGGYSDYSDWSECSVACGGGFQTRSRTCTNPAPSKNGAPCAGQARDSQPCNFQPCPTTEPDTDDVTEE